MQNRKDILYPGVSLNFFKWGPSLHKHKRNIWNLLNVASLFAWRGTFKIAAVMKHYNVLIVFVTFQQL